MVLGLLEENMHILNPPDDQNIELQVIDEVIEAINREFDSSTLRSPNKEDQGKVKSRIHVLVGKSYRQRGLYPPIQDHTKITDEIARRVLGLGFLDLFLPPARTDLSEITIYSTGLVQVMPKGSVRWETVDLKVDANEVWRIITLLLGGQSKALNEATPSVNARLPATLYNPGGGRIKVLHPVIAPGNGYPSVNIRLYEQKPVHSEWLLERGLMPPEMMEFLGSAVREGRRILITGGTRTGKTTLLSALCNYLPVGWRIIKIEDPAEIWIDRDTVQTIEGRPVPPGSEVPPYTLADGVDDAMRMAPDYLIVGEVRDGKAALAMFRAMLTGHSGAGTFHANSPREAFRRLATIMGADEGIRPHEAAQVMADSIDLLVQIGIRDEVRRITEIVQLSRITQRQGVRFRQIWRYDDHSSPDDPHWIWLDGNGIECSDTRKLL
ncbi:MAG: ATPase, T2SS/T4P/T4SS family [Anaerolineales bacterium]